MPDPKIYSTLIDCAVLADALSDHAWICVDCRHDLTAPEAGADAYRAGHIPGAVFAHLDRELSGPPLSDCGRHPLPSPEALRELFGGWGISTGTQVVAYDAQGGAFAARLWWMLRYMGHEACAVLDGGWQAWCELPRPMEQGAGCNSPVAFSGEPRLARRVLIDEVPDVTLLIDSRDPARYRGENETLDPRGGHIPGAVNHFWKNNLDESGRFLPGAEIQDGMRASIGQIPTASSVFYCGSGVTACHNILAMVHAGGEEPRLYVGSWSEWSRTPGRPTET